MADTKIDSKLDLKLLEVCSRCGACYNLCPCCLHIEGYDPRAVIKGILDGDHESWLTSKHIWQCLECHHCLEMCFQHYGFENAMVAMRALSTKKGHNPPQVRKGWDTFVKTGRLGEPKAPQRKKLGLPDPPESGREEFLKLLEAYEKHRAGGGTE